jgi:hypothetical protein
MELQFHVNGTNDHYPHYAFDVVQGVRKWGFSDVNTSLVRARLR